MVRCYLTRLMDKFAVHSVVNLSVMRQIVMKRRAQLGGIRVGL
jgi:hypothetical protein